MNQRLNLEQATQFVLSPGSDSELSELSDMMTMKKMKSSNFYKKKS